MRSLQVFALLFTSIFLLHIPLLRLPYFWDEAGYFIPAARDLLLTGSLVPRSTPSNAHPPLVMAYLALWWKFSGFTPAVTRTAMLLIAAFGLLGVFRLARLLADSEVAVAATCCTALYPVFFAQSSLVHLDTAAATFAIWGLYAYLQNQRLATAIWFSLAVLAKETALLAPLGLLLWEFVCPFLLELARWSRFCAPSTNRAQRIISLAFCFLPLGLWFAYHFFRTGYLFGNPEFVSYNLHATLHPLRIIVAGVQRIWQVVGYMNLFLLTATAALAMRLPPLSTSSAERPRIDLGAQAAFAVVVLSYVAALSVVGGAVLARYMLPVVPLVIIVCVSTIWRRVRAWKVVISVVGAGFVLALFVNPPWGFAPEDNLAYRDYVLLHKSAAEFVGAHYANSRILTAWPASDELARPYLGYVRRSLRLVAIDDFSLPQVVHATEMESRFDTVLLFSTKYEPPHRLLPDWPAWERIKTRYFGYHRDLPPEAAAQLLRGQIVFESRRGGQWIALIDLQHVESAANNTGENLYPYSNTSW
jgi:hypothetical protein